MHSALSQTRQTHYAGNKSTFNAPATMAHWASEGNNSAIEALAHSCREQKIAIAAIAPPPRPRSHVRGERKSEQIREKDRYQQPLARSPAWTSRTLVSAILFSTVSSSSILWISRRPLLLSLKRLVFASLPLWLGGSRLALYLAFANVPGDRQLVNIVALVGQSVLIKSN